MTRYKELDSLRGISALVVLIYHVLMLHPLFFNNTYGDDDYFLANVIKYSPLRLFFAGEEAVILFFVVSGFVLSFSFLKGKKVNYGLYVLKKVCRIYIPFIISIIIAAFLAINLPLDGIEGYETHSMLQTPVSFKLMTEHVLMIGEYDSSALNPPIWFLVHYMRIVLIFPFVMPFVIKNSWKKIIPFGLSLSVLGTFFDLVIPAQKATISFSKSIHYLAFFIIGALLAKYKNELIHFFKNTSKPIRFLVLSMSLLAITYPWWFGYGMPLIHHMVIDQWVVALGVSLLIISSLSWVNLSKFLLQKTFLFLGEISYSLFLVHMLVAFSALYLLGDRLPYPIIAGIIIVVAIIAAYIYSITVEKLAEKIGKELTSKEIERTKNKVQEKTF